jgi:Fe(3+) dicitrate transport protein
MKYSIIIFIFLTTISTLSAQSIDTSSIDSVVFDNDFVIISAKSFFGSKQTAFNRAGSGYFISHEELKKQVSTDISRILAQVPGVSSYDEDGHGLRPNISIRGVNAERSAKITIMEDGILAAPAPYSAPAAYYFPTAARMHAVEILKGSSQIEYGPFTTGGAINMLSTPLPTKDFQLSTKLRYGNFGSRQAYVNFGQKIKKLSYLIEGNHFGTNGFKTLNNGDNTGFEKNDLMAKVNYTFGNAKWSQQLEIKGKYSNEVSNETYLGVSANDFEKNPFFRYDASALDRMTNNHLQTTISHTIQHGEGLLITTTAYHNDFSRNWFRISDVEYQGTKKSISATLQDTAQNINQLNVLRGRLNGTTYHRNNNRNYISQGIQTKIDKHFYVGKNHIDIEVGTRYHRDHEDRHQWLNNYDLINGKLNLVTAGTPGTDANSVTSANALASFALVKINLAKKLTIIPGIRHEIINLSTLDYGKADMNRSGSAFKTKENKANPWIPGLGVNYKPFKNLVFFSSVHKGFSPPSSDSGSEPEQSINLELGTRYQRRALYIETVIYQNNYSNLLGSDLAASGGAGTLDQFNAGATTVKGVEAIINYDLLRGANDKFRIPLAASYTWTHTEFNSSFQSKDGVWGKVSIGDEIPFIPSHQGQLSIGVEANLWSINLSNRYNGSFRTIAGQGDYTDGKFIPSYIVSDVNFTYKLGQKWELGLSALNVFNNTYLVATVPAGLRPGHPMMIQAMAAYRI